LPGRKIPDSGSAGPLTGALRWAAQASGADRADGRGLEIPGHPGKTRNGIRPAQLPRLRAALLAWFDRSRRDLPWRSTRDPYEIWISEVMLQQTRVEVVLARYRRFLDAFPTVEALASAEPDKVLAAWSGLGYYSRARRLHAAARILVERHDGRFPADPSQARRIPGVGRYTSAAVLSIAYGLPHAAVDGNVTRVLNRLQLPSPGRAASVQEAADRLLDPRRPGDHNQAVMELGATVCRPHAPRCAGCPLSPYCRSFREGTTEQPPPPRPRREIVRWTCELCLVRDRRKRLLLQRGAWPLLPHLWLPPIRTFEGETQTEPDGHRTELGRFRHSITHHRILFRVLGTRDVLSRKPRGAEWFSAQQILEIGRSSILDKALRLECAALARHSGNGSRVRPGGGAADAARSMDAGFRGY
jgi:A/G-specific adenine glycosylase